MGGGGSKTHQSFTVTPAGHSDVPAGVGLLQGATGDSVPEVLEVLEALGVQAPDPTAATAVAGPAAGGAAWRGSSHRRVALALDGGVQEGVGDFGVGDGRRGLAELLAARARIGSYQVTLCLAPSVAVGPSSAR